MNPSSNTGTSGTRSIADLVLDDVVAALRFGRSVLLQAAVQGHEDVLRYLLQRISSSSSSDLPPSSPFGQPELGKALSEAFLGSAEQGHAHCLSALLEPEAPFRTTNIHSLVNARNKRGETALIMAAQHGRRDCVKILLQHNPEAQVTAANKAGATALLFAADIGDAECAGQLLQYNPAAQLTAANKYGHTALILAADRGHAAVITQLLQHSPEAQVAARSNSGSTALICAAFQGRTHCLRMLLQHSPKEQVMAAADNGVSALSAAVSNNHPDCVALLLAHSPSAQIAAVRRGPNLIESAARLGRPQCLDLLLAHNPQPQHLDAAWLSALRQWDAAHAHTSPHTQCLERLLAEGAGLPSNPKDADKAKHRLFIKDFGRRALAPDRANEAIVGLVLMAKGKKQKAGQGED